VIMNRSKDFCSIREATPQDAEHLADILCHDEILRDDLGVKESPTANDVIEKLSNWWKDAFGISFAIIHEGKAVGLISLGHINSEEKTARIGYWIASENRAKGICSMAFDEILQIARERGIREVSASVRNDNVPSKKIWQKRGAIGQPITEERTRFHFHIDSKLAPRPPNGYPT